MPTYVCIGIHAGTVGTMCGTCLLVCSPLLEMQDSGGPVVLPDSSREEGGRRGGRRGDGGRRGEGGEGGEGGEEREGREERRGADWEKRDV